jgi:hypothetical protein
MELAYSSEYRDEFVMSARTRLAVIVGLTLASWIVPAALIYGLLRLF